MMQAESMKALMGASANINLVNTPMRVFKEAERRGDTETMKRAFGYASELDQKAEKEAEKLGEETVKETREARKQQEIEREQAIAKAHLENKAQREQAADGVQKPNAGAVGAVETSSAAADGKARDSIEISDSGKAAITEKMLSGELDSVVREAAAVLYSSSAATQPLEQPRSAVMDVKG